MGGERMQLPGRHRVNAKSWSPAPQVTWAPQQGLGMRRAPPGLFPRPLQRHLPLFYLPARRAVGTESVHLEYRTQSVKLRTCSGGKTAQCAQDFPILELEVLTWVHPMAGHPQG